MISLFQIASDDQSVYYLGRIFGSIGTVLTPGGEGTSTLNIIGAMFKSLNTTALVLGAILVTYTTVVGLIKTAHEGQFLGKEWSSLWVPLRMVLGIAALFPTNMGYSALQIVMMWFILQGVGAADSLWTVILNYVNLMGSPYATVGIPSSVGISHDLKSLFQALTCEDAAKRQSSHTYIANPDSPDEKSFYDYCAGPAASFDPFTCRGVIPPLSQVLANPHSYPGWCTFQVDDDGHPTTTCAIGPFGACGSITMGDSSQVNCGGSDLPSQIACNSYRAQKEIMTGSSGIVARLEAIAKQVNDADSQYFDFYQNMQPTPANKAPGFLLNYCKQKDIPEDKCCLFEISQVIKSQTSDDEKNKSSSSGKDKPAKPVVIDYTHLFPTPCLTRTATKTIFPDSSATVSGSTDITNMNTKTAQDIVLRCAIAPLLTGETDKCMAGMNKKADFISPEVKNYTKYLNDQLAPLFAALQKQNSDVGKLTGAETTGWLLAGGYYYKLAKMTDDNMGAAIPPFSVDGTDPTTTENNPLTHYRNNFAAAGTIVDKIMGMSSSSALAKKPGFASIAPEFSGTAGDILNIFMGPISGGKGDVANPLVTLQGTGEALLMTAQILYGVFIIVFFVLLFATKINVMALGTGLTDNPFATAMQFVANSLYTLLIAFLAWCIVMGGLLAVYTPLIPYTIFTFGAIGWFCQVIEAMVAGPFVALGILAPGGRHDLLGHAEPSFMMLLDIFLRPTLMVTGMMFAMLLGGVVVSMINASFKGVMNDIISMPSLPELIMFCTAYVMLVLTALNKCFALIHLLPENVLRWIGGQGRAAGEDEGLGAMKGGVEAGSGFAAGAAKGSMGGAQELGKASEKGAKDKADAAKQAGAAATQSKQHQELLDAIKGNKGGG